MLPNVAEVGVTNVTPRHFRHKRTILYCCRIGDPQKFHTAPSGDGDGFDVTFHGVRGSTPCHSPKLVKYGGNTACVSIDIDGNDPVLFDLGTGLRYFGQSLTPAAPLRAKVLLSHLHWDHIQGLPFFTPLLQDGSHLTIYGPAQEGDLTLQSVFADTIKPPLFPVHLEMLPGLIDFVDCWQNDFSIGTEAVPVDVMARSIPHVGNTLGYRVTARGASVAYLSDHQMPVDGSLGISDGALELCRGADLIIHDAQYTPSEFARKSNWGHCTIEYAVWVAAHAGAKQLALFHHDPTHDDAMIDVLAADAERCGRELGVEVFAAREGQTIRVGG
ncbi:MAG: phosphoribosyl 1,2-cyclic phosphodiesterase [Ilumatobacter sp.]|jgi:phosphoribosyl 1,2-cyclic phosphodiesterase